MFSLAAKIWYRAGPVVVVLGLFLVLSASWAVRVPIPIGADSAAWGNFNPDEASHIRTIEYLATHRRPPPYTLPYITSHHPPLYYLLGAVVYAAAAPLVGAEGAFLLLRLLSCLMGAATVFLAYLAARHLLPRPAALLAAGCVAGVPMFVAMSASINNDGLAALTATGALYVMVVGLRRGFGGRRTLALSLWVAANIASKVTGLGLLPAALVAVWWDGKWRRSAAINIAKRVSVVVGVSALLMGWWFVRNTLTYGDPMRQAAHYRMMHRAQPSFADFAARRGTTPFQYGLHLTRRGWMSFWGVFDAMSRAFPMPVYAVTASVQAGCAAGFVLWWRRRKRRTVTASVWLMALLAVFVAAVFYRFNWVHYTPQGRYFFPLLLPFGLFTAAGWRALFPPRLRNLASVMLLACLLVLNVYAVAVMPNRP